MDIKLRARLSAYAKIDSVQTLNSELPSPYLKDSGAVLGVGDAGKYTLFPSVGVEDIENLFRNKESVSTVDKTEIDGLFDKKETAESVTKSEIDTLFMKKTTAEAVDKTEIDTLFQEDNEPETVDKETIDTLFENKTVPDENAGTVSFADIDSLFR